MAVPRTSPAVLNARLRYAPQRQALAAAVQEARAEHQAAIAGAQSEARLNQNAVQHAVPNVQGIYQRAQDSSGQMHTQLAAALAALPGVAPFQAAAGTEAAQGAERTARERASAEAALGAQALAASTAPAFARTLADQHLGTTLQKILTQGNALGSQEGADIASNLTSEAKERAKAKADAAKEARQAREGAASRALQEAGLNQKGEEGAKNRALSKWEHEHPNASSGGTVYTAPGVKQGTTDQHNSARDAIETIRHEAYELRHDEHVPFSQAKAELEEPVPKLRKAYPNDGKLKAALELAYFGGISDGTIAKLKAEGYSPKQLGYPRYTKVNGRPRLERIK